MIKDQGLSFETQLKIEFLPPNNGSNKCLEKSLLADVLFCNIYIIASSSFVFENANITLKRIRLLISQD